MVEKKTRFVEVCPSTEVLQSFVNTLYEREKSEFDNGRGYQLLGRTSMEVFPEYLGTDRSMFWEGKFVDSLLTATPDGQRFIGGRFLARSHEEVLTGVLAGTLASKLEGVSNPVVVPPEAMREFSGQVYPGRRLIDNGFGFGGPEGRSFGDVMILTKGDNESDAKIAAICEMSLHADWDKVEKQYHYSYERFKAQHPSLFSPKAVFLYMAPRYSGLENKVLHRYISRQAYIPEVPYSYTEFSQFFGDAYKSVVDKAKKKRSSLEQVVYTKNNSRRK